MRNSSTRERTVTRVVLVRQWRITSLSGGGCCSVDAAGVRDAPRPQVREAHEDGEHDSVATAYRMLRERLPDVDVQVVTADNTGFLLPATYGRARARLGRLAAIREAVRSTTAGAVLVDGQFVGEIDQLGATGVLREVTARKGR